MKIVLVSFSEVFGGYYVTDAECPKHTASGCQCLDQDHDIVRIFEKDQRAIVRLGLPDMEHNEIREMEWVTPLAAKGDDR